MPSDLQRPTPHRPEQPVYRPSRGGMDPTTKRLAVMAGAIGVVLLALVGGWSLAGRHEGGVPVIEPPAGPERVKPADPGGMQLMGAEPPPANNDAGGTALAPAPEKPDRQALQAELDRATKDAAANEAAAPAEPTPTRPLSPAASPPAASPPTTGTKAPASLSRHVEVQLAAMDTEAAARAEWSRLAAKDPALFAARRPVIVAANHDGKTFYRLRTGDFDTVASATDFCQRSRAAGAACTIAAF